MTNYATLRLRHDDVQGARDAFAAEAFGSRSVFANLLRNTLSTSFRLNVYFTPNLTQQRYAQPFVPTEPCRETAVHPWWSI